MTDLNEILSFSEASEHLGIAPRTVSDLVRYWKIETRSVPRNGAARGLDKAAMDRLRSVLDTNSIRNTI